MTSISRNVYSPLNHSRLFSIGEVVFWDKGRFPEILSLDDDTPYLVQKGQRLDTLASVTLGSGQLGWVIMIRNGLGLAPNDLVPGTVIFIPSIDGLKQRGII
jgi:hypothetical protein